MAKKTKILNTKNILLLSGFVIFGTASTVGLYLKKKNRKELIKFLNKELESGTRRHSENSSGALSNQLHKEENIQLFDTATALDYAKKFKRYVDDYNPFVDEEMHIRALLNQMPSKAHLSQVSEIYLKEYTETLSDGLKSLGSSDYQTFQKIIESLPTRVIKS